MGAIAIRHAAARAEAVVVPLGGSQSLQLRRLPQLLASLQRSQPQRSQQRHKPHLRAAALCPP